MLANPESCPEEKLIRSASECIAAAEEHTSTTTLLKFNTWDSSTCDDVKRGPRGCFINQGEFHFNDCGEPEIRPEWTEMQAVCLKSAETITTTKTTSTDASSTRITSTTSIASTTEAGSKKFIGFNISNFVWKGWDSRK